MWLQWVWLTIINHKKVKEKLSSRLTELRWGDPQWGEIDNIANNIYNLEWMYKIYLTSIQVNMDS